MKYVTARVCLMAPEQGGKQHPIGNGGDYACPVFFLDSPELSAHGYDCRLLLSRNERTISPGETASDVPLAFLSSNEVLAHVRVGMRFTLWESGVIGEGEITALGVE